ncbi:adult-specific rigid cuticular protein 15.5 [Ixodes scapularis]|uniref:adult-specific rigid cuticular protein 15.5 n=1 Tax=Ixodes scapularis TaxID=6945 RepID=UPI001AD79C16|nr:adult-specific rigid cuticular protein 15.5 [Ixodes scapularis]
MKVAILFALAAVASAGHLHAPVVHAAAVLESGHSTQHRTQDLAGNYKFGYKESHTSGGSFRQEAGDAWGNKVGSYGLTDADGRVRVVKYVADGHGFRASVHTNEPGTAASHPAAASFDAPHKVAAVGVAVAAPVAKVAVAAPVLAAPVAVAHAAPVAVAHAAPVAVAHAAPVAVAHSAPVAVAHAAPVAVGYGHGYGYGHGLGLGYGLGHGYGHGVAVVGHGYGLGYGHGLGLGLGYGHGLGYGGFKHY